MTTPAIVPLNRSGTYRDYLQTKCDRQGVERAEENTVSVPTGTVTTTIVGMIPFNKGFRVVGGVVSFAALGAGVTASIGYIYDDNVTYTNNQTAFVSASTTAAAGGQVALVNTTGFVAAANGWIVLTTGGATTGSTGSVGFQVEGVYDGLQVANR